MQPDEYAYSPLHREGDEGQVLKLRDLSVIQRGECFLLPCMRNLDVRYSSGGGSTHGDNLHMSHMRRAVGGGNGRHTAHFAIAVYSAPLVRSSGLRPVHTSCMLGTSNNSPKTRTPGEPVASRINFAAAAPLADFDMSRNGSTFARNPAPRSIFLSGKCRDVGECERCS